MRLASRGRPHSPLRSYPQKSTKDHKFIRHHEDGKRELYTLREDIGETNNLVSVMPAQAAALEAKLDEWLTATGAYIPVPDPDLVTP